MAAALFSAAMASWVGSNGRWTITPVREAQAPPPPKDDKPAPKPDAADEPKPDGDAEPDKAKADDAAPGEE